ncbi:carotenoid biosynthesis protein [Massilia aurea]|uniref:carotenoid biosynthesis protein n=1 Tax=Massilia aurea TaxID=373040 RepID=UPI0034631BEB
MTLTPTALSRLAAGLGAAALLALLLRGWNAETQLLVISSVLMFLACCASAARVLGPRPALHLVLIALPVGWFAEEMGANYGWFFGSYDYTPVLGPQLGSVPLVIPLMWFALSYTGYVMANLIVWQIPADGATSIRRSVVMAVLAALIVTAYDLGVDPYMVYKLKAWIMMEKDGWWFGETLQGFFGWMLVAFAIVLAFRLTLRRAQGVTPAAPAPRVRDILVPLGLYGALMVFEVTQGVPVETRTIALFVMGMPLFCAACGLYRWQLAPGATVRAAA